MSAVKITRIGHEAAPTPTRASGKTRKHSMRTFPKGILRKTSKIQGVRDPAKAPPVRKSAIKGTLRILTEKGMQKRRTNIKKTIRNMSDGTVRSTLKASNMQVSDKTPPHIAREILEGGMEAGMIVVK